MPEHRHTEHRVRVRNYEGLQGDRGLPADRPHREQLGEGFPTDQFPAAQRDHRIPSTVPRQRIENIEQSVPQSRGDQRKYFAHRLRVHGVRDAESSRGEIPFYHHHRHRYYC